jgi:hypothetical protein
MCKHSLIVSSFTNPSAVHVEVIELCLDPRPPKTLYAADLEILCRQVDREYGVEHSDLLTGSWWFLKEPLGIQEGLLSRLCCQVCSAVKFILQRLHQLLGALTLTNKGWKNLFMPWSAQLYLVCSMLFGSRHIAAPLTAQGAARRKHTTGEGDSHRAGHMLT